MEINKKGKARLVYKVFSAVEGSEYDGFFCLFETHDSFWGYRIEKAIPKCGVSIFLGSTDKANRRYINCDQLYEFPKTVHFEKLETRYKLRELRAVLESLRTGRRRQSIVNGKFFEIENYDSITPEQRRNRRIPEYHQQLKEAKALRERAILQNDRKREKELTQMIDEINYKLGYKETVNPGKYKKQLKDTVTNTKPLPGGSCTPK